MDVSEYLQRQQNPQQCYFPKLLYLRRADLGWLLAWSCSLAQGSHVPTLSLRRRHRLTGEPHPQSMHIYLSIYLCIYLSLIYLFLICFIQLPLITGSRPPSPSASPAAFPSFHHKPPVPSSLPAATPSHKSVISARSTTLLKSWTHRASRDLKDPTAGPTLNHSLDGETEAQREKLTCLTDIAM